MSFVDKIYFGFIVHIPFQNVCLGLDFFNPFKFNIAVECWELTPVILDT
jgi:hypothetical protein